MLLSPRKILGKILGTKYAVNTCTGAYFYCYTILYSFVSSLLTLYTSQNKTFVSLSIFIGLDPHTVQPAPKIKKAGTNKGKNDREWSVDLTDEYLASVHTSSPEVLDMNQMDPSIALGFYCRNKQDFHDLERALTKTDSKSSASPQLVSFVDKLPGYMAAATENETGIHDLDDDDAFFDDPKDTISDEDDYVLL